MESVLPLKGTRCTRIAEKVRCLLMFGIKNHQEVFENYSAKIEFLAWTFN